MKCRGRTERTVRVNSCLGGLWLALLEPGLDSVDLVGSGDEQEPVARLYHGVAFGDHHVGVALDGADEDEVGCLQRDDAGSRLIERVDDLHDLGAVVDAGKMVDVVYLQPVEDL